VQVELVSLYLLPEVLFSTR